MKKMILKKITLNKWLLRNTKMPLLILGVMVALAQVCFVAYTHNRSKETQTKSIKKLVATVIQIGIHQKNRPLLESSFQLAMEELGVRSMIFCEGTRKIFHQPFGFGNCPHNLKEGFFESVIEVNPSGFKDHHFYFYVDRFHIGPSLIALNVIILVFLSIVFIIIYRIQKHLSKDIFLPLESHLSGGDEIYIEELDAIRNKFEEYRKSKEKQAVAGAIIEYNMSINHNIKSMKQTLDVIMSGEFSSERQKQRFNQVSNDFKRLMAKIADQIPDRNKVSLITSDKTFFEYLEKENEKTTKVCAVDAFEIACEHKKIEKKSSKNDLRIEISYDDEVKKLYIEAVDPELRGIFSNLMNNSIESGATHIEINLRKEETDLVATIFDNGKGIPQDIKENIFQRGFSWEKEGGTGYGLYHAQRFIRSWHGEFHLLESKKGRTEFEIKLPIWSPSSMDIDSAGHIVILDDEDSVHDQWLEKMNSINPEAKVLSFKKPHEFQDWFNENEIFSHYIFFFDSDLGEHEENGEHLINEMGLNHISYLVTNNYNNPNLTKWCDERAIQVIPKGYLLG